jgi:hypothetical protein
MKFAIGRNLQETSFFILFRVISNKTQTLPVLNCETRVLFALI